AQPDTGETDTNPSVAPDGSDLAAAPTAEAIAAAPLAGDARDFGADGATAPGNGVPHGNGTQPRNGTPPSIGGAPGNGTAPGNGDAPGVLVPPATIPGEENRLPIFESVESDWFRRGRLGSD